MRHLLRTLLLCIFAAGVCAQSQPPPSATLASLVDSERAFAKMSVDQGRRAAFLAYFGDDAIFLAPGPVNARQTIQGWPTQAAARLDWEPRFGDVAGAGDLGYTTGPFVRTSAANGEGGGTGWYFTVWKKQPDGRWKVAIDAGITSPPDGALRSSSFRAAAATPVAATDSAARSLVGADRALCESIASAGVAAALVAASSDETRVYRDTQRPIVGSAAIRSFFTPSAERMSCPPAKDETAQSGDLGYTYGSYVLERTPRESGWYLRVWTRRSGQWKLAFDLLVPGA